MDLDDIKRGLRAEIKKRENEQYATFQCNVWQMCKDVLAKLEEQESEIADKDAKILALDAEVFKQKHHAELFFDERNYAETQLRHSNHKRCLAMARWCESKVYHIRRTPLCDMDEHEYWQYENDFWQRWQKRWLELADKFKPNSTAQKGKGKQNGKRNIQLW